MTSNLGTSGVPQESIGFKTSGNDSVESANQRAEVEDALKRAFRPEFLNRIDDVIIFDSLTQEDTLKIVGKLLGEVQARVAELGVSIELTESARKWLAKEGFDRMYGARPLRRAIQRHVENELSKRILSGKLVRGSMVKIDGGENGLTFEESSVSFEVEEMQSEQSGQTADQTVGKS